MGNARSTPYQQQFNQNQMMRRRPIGRKIGNHTKNQGIINCRLLNLRTINLGDEISKDMTTYRTHGEIFSTRRDARTSGIEQVLFLYLPRSLIF
jgi:hypothetical protein